jgi:SOS response regulatory protein OraA/RecX
MFVKHSDGLTGKALAVQSALQHAFRLVARAEQYSAGLSLKLQKKGYGKTEIKSVLKTLSETGMLDDSRYARFWTESRIKYKAFSPRQIMLALLGKGINRDIAGGALKNALGGVNGQPSVDELSLLRRFTAKYGLSAAADGCNLRGKLRREGFSAEVLERYFDE